MNKDRYNKMRILLWAVLAAVCSSAVKAFVDIPQPHLAAEHPDGAESRDSLLPGTYPVGTLKGDSTEVDMTQYIQALARTYGDSIVLRWAISSFPEWVYLNHTGYDILRHCDDEPGFSLDTLATGLRPWSLQKFKAHYPDQSDSLAYMAMGALYGTGDMTAEMTNYEPGSVGAFAELEQDQKTRLLAAYLPAEWRPDLAAALGLRFVDRKVKRGQTYSYYILPSRPDTTGNFLIAEAQIEGVKNEPYRRTAYDVSITDSVTGHGAVTLSWNDDVNGTFEVYVRPYGTEEWTKITQRPYAPPLKFEFDNQFIIYEHVLGKTGDYEYAVQAHDAFGDLTEMSAPHKVHFPDMMPPVGPEITRIVIDRPGEALWEKVYATVYFHKDSLEKDFVRYIPLYYNQRDSLKQWRLLSDQYIAPTDTMVRIDVTNVSTGMMTIAAVDTAENMGYAFPRLLRVRDAKPPVAPKNLHAIPTLDGTVAVMWEMDDTLDVHYYNVLYANAPDHEFTPANHQHIFTRSFTDTIAVDLNARYIYYTVRAVDWEMNEGACSDTIRVLRPNTGVPSRAHLDSAWVDNKMIHMRWIGGGDEIISHYNVYRRAAGMKDWTLIRTLDGDSVKAHNHVMLIDDAPGGALNQRFEYAVETVSFWDIHSELTPVFSAKLDYDKIVPVSLQLFGDYSTNDRMAKLAWEVKDVPEDVPYFFCLYRKLGNGASFRYITDVPKGTYSYSDPRLSPGETVEYYVSIRFEDGRQTPKSNTLSITAPKQQNTD